MLPLLFSILKFQMRKSASRAQILKIQQKQFRSLLHYTFDHSAFYHDLYTSQGIKKGDLNTIPVSDLPLTSKELLMENFDDVVTDKRLKKDLLWDWIENNKNTKGLFSNEFVVLHTSGSTGKLGIMVYDQKAWNTLKASLVTRVSQINLNPFKKTKIAFYAATHGRFAGVSLINDAPDLLYKKKAFSLLTPIQGTIDELNAFQPDQLSGYASTMAQLAELQKENKIHIAPQRVLTSGDPLTEDYEKTIKSVWHADVINLYACSESIGIAARLPGHDYLTVFDDLHIIEIVDEQMQEVADGENGQIVMTNLYNHTFPLIRYTMKDIAIKGTANEDKQFSTIKNIIGRVHDMLPIVKDNNDSDFLHPLVLVDFYVPGLKKVQFISHKSDHVEIRYISNKETDKLVREKFKGLLRMKDAVNGTKIQVKRVASLPNDPKTGKFKLVITNN